MEVSSMAVASVMGAEASIARAFPDHIGSLTLTFGDIPMLDTIDNRISLYQPEQKGLIFPEIPTFVNHAEERQYRKQHLVAAVRAFAMHGFDYGFAGHLTVCAPEHPELYWTNPMCVHFSQVKMSNLDQMFA
jgi:hypothetical protein